MSDLSEYEKRRLENIRRNEARLIALGLSGPISKQLNLPQNKPKTTQKSAAVNSSDVRKRKRAPTKNVRVTRSSRRLQQQRQDEQIADAVDSSEDDDSIDYESMPVEPQHLDDDEFEVYVSLRAWRLGRCRELEIEPYKVCQNRTLCEITRRRRNDPTFCRGDTASAVVRAQMRQVWGIGPSKLDSFGPEMIAILDSPGNTEKLRHSALAIKNVSNASGNEASN